MNNPFGLEQELPVKSGTPKIPHGDAFKGTKSQGPSNLPADLDKSSKEK